MHFFPFYRKPARKVKQNTYKIQPFPTRFAYKFSVLPPKKYRNVRTFPLRKIFHITIEIPANLCYHI